MKKKWKMLLHLALSIVICFVIIYIFVFFGGWRLFESGDPILLEIAAAIGLGMIIWIIFELTKVIEARLEELEARISELEKK